MRLTLRVIVWLLWPATTWATSITLDATLAAVPALAWLMVLVLSCVSGLAALLARWNESEPEKPRLFAAAHMAGSLLFGLVVFLACENADLADFAEAMFIAIGAYAGARGMDAVSKRLVEVVSR